MNLKDNLNYRIICDFDVAEIANEISSLDPKFWEVNLSRQTKFHQHKKTKSIFVYDIDFSWNGIGYPLEKYFVSDALNDLTDLIKDKLEKQIDGKVGKAIYINLPAGESIGTHCDSGHYLTSVHRLHIPILTNDSVEFFLNGEVINMKAGICYEINNANLHGVTNKGSTDRIHLLMDIIPTSFFK